MESDYDLSTQTLRNLGELKQNLGAKCDANPSIDIGNWSSENYTSFQLQQYSFIDNNTCACNFFVRETSSISSSYSRGKVIYEKNNSNGNKDDDDVKEVCFYKGKNNMGLCMNSLRSLSLQVGVSLERLCMSHNTNFADEMLQVLCARFYGLKHLDLSFCIKLTDACCEIISNFCGKTLLSLNVSGCHLLTNEACKWISGLNGMKKRCGKLQYLNLSSCIKVDSRGLQYLGSGGCRNLMYLNVMNCTSISDTGIRFLAKGCRNLKKLSVRGCYKIGDKGISSVSKHCNQLLSLNLALCQSITSQSLVMLSKGCLNLQSISLEGIPTLQPKDVCIFIRKCRDLTILNITGCGDTMTKYDILALTKGKKYVREAKTFFGIVPIEGVLKMLIQTGEINKKIESAICIQKSFRSYQIRNYKANMVKYERKKYDAVICIQHHGRQYLYYARYKKQQRIRLRHSSATMLQKVIRGYQGRKLYIQALRTKILLHQKTKSSIVIQANYRSYYTRFLSHSWIQHHLKKFRYHRKLLKSSNIIRYCIKRFLFHCRIKVRDLEQKRKSSAIIIQAFVRHVLAKWYVRSLYAVLCDRCRRATIIQCCLRKYEARKIYKVLKTDFNVKLWGKHVSAKRIQYRVRILIRHNSALRIQACYRGYIYGRRIAKELRHAIKLATLLQSLYRASRIPHWKDLRMNKACGFIFQRHKYELYNGWKNYLYRFSHPYEEEMMKNCIDKDDNHSDEYESERLLIGYTCKIFQAAKNEYLLGNITKFNKFDRKWRVEYVGDHEWINFDDESDRVLILSQEEETYVPCRMFQHPSIVQKQSLEREKNMLKTIALSWAPVDSLNNDQAYVEYYSYASEETRYVNQGEFEAWKVAEDEIDRSNWFYQDIIHRHKISWDEPDPRFINHKKVLPSTNDNIQQEIDNIMVQLRMSAYICRGLLQELNQEDEECNENILIIRKIQASEARKELTIFLSKALKIWNDDKSCLDSIQEEIFSYEELQNQIDDILQKYQHVLLSVEHLYLMHGNS